MYADASGVNLFAQARFDHDGLQVRCNFPQILAAIRIALLCQHQIRFETFRSLLERLGVGADRTYNWIVAEYAAETRVWVFWWEQRSRKTTRANAGACFSQPPAPTDRTADRPPLGCPSTSSHEQRARLLARADDTTHAGANYSRAIRRRQAEGGGETAPPPSHVAHRYQRSPQHRLDVPRPRPRDATCPLAAHVHPASTLRDEEHACKPAGKKTLRLRITRHAPVVSEPAVTPRPSCPGVIPAVQDAHTHMGPNRASTPSTSTRASAGPSCFRWTPARTRPHARQRPRRLAAPTSSRMRRTHPRLRNRTTEIDNARTPTTRRAGSGSPCSRRAPHPSSSALTSACTILGNSSLHSPLPPPTAPRTPPRRSRPPSGPPEAQCSSGLTAHMRKLALAPARMDGASPHYHHARACNTSAQHKRDGRGTPAQPQGVKKTRVDGRMARAPWRGRRCPIRQEKNPSSPLSAVILWSGSKTLGSGARAHNYEILKRTCAPRRTYLRPAAAMSPRLRPRAWSVETASRLQHCRRTTRATVGAKDACGESKNDAHGGERTTRQAHAHLHVHIQGFSAPQEKEARGANVGHDGARCRTYRRPDLCEVKPTPATPVQRKNACGMTRSFKSATARKYRQACTGKQWRKDEGGERAAKARVLRD
ncbi:hypothetical protein C8J57DRAFT_1229610 [Mycena rebaudengoi]|nr:hypothetical protein C8J57DRAFT_1229610 [Mycena rebaudengoi]